jgi:hypothetical protein
LKELAPQWPTGSSSRRPSPTGEAAQWPGLLRCTTVQNARQVPAFDSESSVRPRNRLAHWRSGHNRWLVLPVLSLVARDPLSVAVAACRCGPLWHCGVSPPAVPYVHCVLTTGRVWAARPHSLGSPTASSPWRSPVLHVPVLRGTSAVRSGACDQCGWAEMEWV